MRTRDNALFDFGVFLASPASVQMGKRNNSIQLYSDAARVVESFLLRSSGIKSLCYSAQLAQPNAVFALAGNTLRFRSFLRHLYALALQSQAEDPTASSRLGKASGCTKLTAAKLMLIYDLIGGEGRLPSFGVATDAQDDPLNLRQSVLDLVPLVFHMRNCVKQLLESKSMSSIAGFLPVSLQDPSCLSRGHPRYARVNLHVTTFEEATIELRRSGYRELRDIPSWVKNTSERANQSQPWYVADPLVPGLLAFAPSDLNIIELATQRPQKFIIQVCLNNQLWICSQLDSQDKASCVPALVLNPTENDVVLDGCAAPGNKTQYLSVLMQNRGTLFAVERDERRGAMLKQRLETTSCSNVTLLNDDFMNLNKKAMKLYPQLKKVTHLLLDPSCSGSGTHSVDRLLGVDAEFELTPNVPIEFSSAHQRSKRKRSPSPPSLSSASKDTMAENESFSIKEVDTLAEQQFALLKHAITNLPNLKRIVYSTCSIFELENERVVHKFLRWCKKNGHSWITEAVLPQWHRRGLVNRSSRKSSSSKQYRFSNDCLRFDANEDDTAGFFVTCFVKSESASSDSDSD